MSVTRGAQKNARKNERANSAGQEEASRRESLLSAQRSGAHTSKVLEERAG